MQRYYLTRIYTLSCWRERTSQESYQPRTSVQASEVEPSSCRGATHVGRYWWSRTRDRFGFARLATRARALKTAEMSHTSALKTAAMSHTSALKTVAMNHESALRTAAMNNEPTIREMKDVTSVLWTFSSVDGIAMARVLERLNLGARIFQSVS